MEKYYKTKSGYYYKNTQKGGKIRISLKEYEKKQQKGGSMSKRVQFIPYDVQEKINLVNYIERHHLVTKWLKVNDKLTQVRQATEQENLIFDKCTNQWNILDENADISDKINIFIRDDIVLMAQQVREYYIY